MYVIYADELFFKNFITDYLLLMASAAIAGENVSRWRAAIAAAAGGVYGVLSVLLGGFSLSCPVKIAVGVLMALIVFGKSKNMLRLSAVFFAVSASFAGLVLAVSRGAQLDFKSLLLAFAAAALFFSVIFRGSARHITKGEIAKVKITLASRSVTLSALVDTGNTLSDPISARPVTVVSLNSVLTLFPPETARILTLYQDPAECLRRLGGSPFCLVPYKAVGGSSMLLAFRPDRAEINGREDSTLIAVTQNLTCEGKGYTALTHAA